MESVQVNPDDVCQQAVSAQLATYRGLEQFQGILKNQNESIQSLVSLVGLMKKRILELENQLRSHHTALSTVPKESAKDGAR
jgi:hypothetical protein